MRYLENEELVHRDLAARNVLLDRNGVAKVKDFVNPSRSISIWVYINMRMCDQFRCHQVADFGLSKGKGEATDNEAFPILWSPPEVTTNPIVSLTCSFW